ncbi:unnamed protein product [Durusdinium trenchii]|uniref:Uncharacterized protein n=1 Tax=Durusdinium trenchii TaxID=1381693 RepID=A0ABP0SKX3_9DINO
MGQGGLETQPQPEFQQGRLLSGREWLPEEKIERAELDVEGAKAGNSRPSEIVRNEWQRSRNKLIDGSPSRRLRVRSPKRAVLSGLSPSRSRDVSENPFCMASETIDNPAAANKDSFLQGDVLSFEERIQALQEKASGLPKANIEAGSWLPVGAKAAPQATGSPSFGSPSSPWRPVRRSPQTGRSQGSDETLASRVSQLEDSLGRIEFMLQQVLGMAGSSGELAFKAPKANGWPPPGRRSPNAKGFTSVDTPEVAQEVGARRGFFKWPMDVTEAAEEARLQQAKTLACRGL